MKKNTKMFFGLAFLAVLLFIWANSMFNGEKSMNITYHVKQFLYSVLGDYGGWWRDFIFYNLRKIAHFIEYMILGFVVSKIVIKSDVKAPISIINAAMICFGVGLLDETIQIFSDRESLVSDIWIDVLGATCGLFIYLLYNFIKTEIKMIKNNSR